MTKLQFLGVSYDPTLREQPSNSPVEHTYRGQRFTAPLRHEQTSSADTTTLYYRGQAYQRRAAAAAAAAELNNN
jgi:hypothetical protein